MFIKSMVIDGFKSYGQRTEINGFDHQFNAITGLNGYVEAVNTTQLQLSKIILQVREEQHPGRDLFPVGYHQPEPCESRQPPGAGLQEWPGRHHQGHRLHHFRQPRQETVRAFIFVFHEFY